MLLGSAALVIATLVVLLHLPGTNFYTMRAPSGPDSMGLALYFFALIAAWALILVGMLAGVSRGAYAWTGAPGPGVVLGVLALCAGLGTVCIAATFASMHTRTPARSLVGLSGGFMLPAVTIAFAGALLWGPREATASARWAWWFAAPLCIVSLCGLGGLGIGWIKGQQARARAIAEQYEEDRKRRAEWRVEQQERDVKHAEELRALPDDTPLSVFVRHLFIDRSEAHHALAIDRIRSLPGLRERLAEALAGEDPLEREYILNFIRMCPDPDPSWGPLVAGAMSRLSTDLRRLAPAGHPHPRGMTVGAVLTAEKFGGPRFEREARELREAISAWPEETSALEGAKAVDSYLAGKKIEWR